MNKWKLLELKIRFMLRLFKSNKGVFVKVCGCCDGFVFNKIKSEGRIKYNGEFKCVKCGAIGIIHEEWTQAETEPEEEIVVLDGINITKPKYQIGTVSSVTFYDKNTNEVVAKFDTPTENITLERKEV